MTDFFNDEEYMRLAVNLAEKGAGFVNPNPMVGAVIVKDDRIIGQGFHAEYGRPHAEINALASCAESPIDATMYVTLEPCCHYGKTPPCTQTVIASGIKKVIIGCLDPNPQISGKGVQALADSSLEVVVGVMEAECQKQNEVFFHFMRTKMPYVIMKYAMTSDGKIATVSGASKWITGEKAREKVHRDRHRYMSIMVGIGTIVADDPLLTCRIEGGKNPVRVICDARLRIPADSHVVKTAKDVKTIIATACEDELVQKPLRDAGCNIIHSPVTGNHIDLRFLMRLLGGMGIDSVLLEGGSSMNFSALKCGIVNKVHTYIAPKIFGGASAKTPVGGDGFSTVSECVKLKNHVIKHFDEDILIESEVDSSCLQES